ncbi:MAG: LysR substrate-binding domain-containing protein [Paracoccaceae bacterium]|nr:LysR substrate-binding domain-containing protein [Paracoccaceae bacterium]
MHSLSGISFRQVRCFLVTCRTLSTAEAARELGITQPAASRRISELEARIGVKLFERIGRRMIPTDPARRLMRDAERALSMLGRGVAVAKGQSSGPLLGIGALPSVASSVVPAVALKLRKIAPQLTVRIETGPGDLLLTRLRNGALDLVVGRMGPAEALRNLSFEPLQRDRLGAFGRPGHPLQGRRLSASDLAEAMLILPPPAAIVRPTVDAFLAARGIITPPGQIEGADPSCIAALLRQSDAIWLASAGAGEGLVAIHSAVALEIDAEDTIGEIGMTCRANEPETPEVAIAREVFRDVAAAP